MPNEPIPIDPSINDNKIRICINLMFQSYITYLHIFNYYDNNNYNRIANYCIVYFLLDMYGVSKIYKIHHIGALIFLTLPYFNNVIIPNIIFDSWLYMERSSVVISLYNLTKINKLKYIFAVLFFYYRILLFPKINMSTIGAIDKEIICVGHQLYPYDLCKGIINIQGILFYILNLYWGIKILKKIKL